MTTDEPTRHVMVSCVSKKRRGKWRASDLYDPSQYFRAQRAYAETFGDAWHILSAKHGLVRPDERIEDYDVTMDDRDEDKWAEQVMDDAVDHIGPNDVVVIVAGSDYADPLTPAFEHWIGCDVIEPFRGERLATRTENMVARVREERNHKLADYQ